MPRGEKPAVVVVVGLLSFVFVVVVLGTRKDVSSRRREGGERKSTGISTFASKMM